MSYYLRRLSGNVWGGGFSSFAEDEVTAVVSARLGGASKAPYRALNLAFHVGDDAATVRQNRQILCRALFIDPNRITAAQQVHGCRVYRVTAADAGKGSADHDSAIADCDALVTNEKNLPLLICVADCVPLMFYDEKRAAIGIAHAGRKGTALNIAAKTISTMTREFGSDPADILAAIGPSIGKCCYEVDAALADEFADYEDCTERSTSANDGKAHLDLWAINRQQLIRCGVKAENIDVAGICTCCEHGWYFSYRADGKTTGRIGALMMLK